MIAWKYLNKKTATADALRDFDSMEFILNNSADDEMETRERMTALPSLSDGQPSAHDPRASESRLVSQLDEIDIIKERYRQALEYMAWFKPAWAELTEEEQYILTEFFLHAEMSKTDAVLNIGDKLCLERAQVYRRKDKAVARLALLLYGKK